MYISVDIGGTNTRVVGAYDLGKATFVSTPLRRRNSTSYEDDITFIVNSAREIGDNDLEAVGIGLVGELSEDKTTSVHSKNNGHWNGKTFAHDLSRELNCPVFAENDGVAAALGEAYYGAVKSDFDYVIWGTGIGGATVIHDASGRPGATMLDWHKYFRDWEYACGGSELANLYGKQPEALSNAEWQKVLSDFKRHLCNFVSAVNPKAVVFGGGLSVRHAKELKLFSEQLQVPCHVTTFDGDSGLYGGFAIIRHSLKS